MKAITDFNVSQTPQFLLLLFLLLHGVFVTTNSYLVQTVRCIINNNNMLYLRDYFHLFQDYECERDEETRQFVQEEIERSTNSLHAQVMNLMNFYVLGLTQKDIQQNKYLFLMYLFS